ncbi:hypothetical protein [Sphingomonas sp.]|uniref:hypothetical protein n=1 Tax=Sphingomonas sp. TaxID=28214 RepID=UPI000DB6F954|nr:hypothetical protein [Sphingomonas sp.]PZU07986.1 MAG: hypothetical protein DI605_14000 [Sphingomonas sp.]
MLALALLLAAATPEPGTQPAPAPQTLPAVTEVARFSAEEARQGVVADGKYVYAISNAEIGKYDRRTHELVERWRGDPARFRHMNSCILAGRQLVCAASNYPEVPQASSIEWFDAGRLSHVRTLSLGPGRGSLTWLDWHEGSWWACFANYAGKGGEPGRDHRYTTLVRYSPDFQEQGAWLFPPSVLERFAPYSSSGGVWGRDGLLYVTGHDRPELYALRLPPAGSILEHVATIPLMTDGQAIAWEEGANRILWGIERKTREAVAVRVPEMTGP